MFVVLELNGRALQHTAAFNVNLVVVVHQDIGDRRILQQRLQRAKTEHLIEDFLDDPIPFRQRHRNVFLQQQFFDRAPDLAAQPFFADQPQRIAVQRLKEFAVNLGFQIRLNVACAG